MKKLSKITESIWSDIQDRSMGKTVREEDDNNNLHKLTPIDLGNHISVLWADKDLEFDDKTYFSFDEISELIKNSEWRLPTLEEVAELDSLYKKGAYSSYSDAFYFEYGKNTLTFEKKGFIYTSASKEPIDFDFYYCWTSSHLNSNNRFVHILTFDNDHPIHTPLNNTDINDTVVQDTHNGKLCVRLVKDKKLSQISESIWSDIQDRSMGKTVRKEDDINLLDRDGLVNYLKQYYDFSDDSLIISEPMVDSILMTLFSINGKYYDITYNNITSNSPSIRFPICQSSNIEKLLNDNYKVKQYLNNIYEISSKDGRMITNSFFIEIVDFILYNLEDNLEVLLKKKERG